MLRARTLHLTWSQEPSNGTVVAVQERLLGFRMVGPMMLCMSVVLLAVSLTSSYKVCKSNNDCRQGNCTCPLSIASDLPNPVFCTSSKDRNTSAVCKECNGRNSTAWLSAKCLQCTSKIVYGPCSDTLPLFCQGDGDCKTSGCSCLNNATSTISTTGNCIDMRLYRERAKKCKTCKKNSDCPGSECSKNLLLKQIHGRKLCADCETGPSLEAMLKCASNNPSTSNHNTKSPPCVSTKWLREKSLSHHTIRHAGRARVLCIPGLPCGTLGHLLHTSSGSLISYREVCETRQDCVQSVMKVSQLSHSFDWSIFRTTDDTHSLTSLSAHPFAGKYGISRLLAMTGDILNNSGLGCLTNAFVKIPVWLRQQQIFNLAASSTWQSFVSIKYTLSVKLFLYQSREILCSSMLYSNKADSIIWTEWDDCLSS